MLYSTFTAYLGFAVNEDEYKVMGLAAYGRPTMIDEVRKLIRRTPDGAFALDLDYFEYQTTAARSYSPRFVELFGRPRNPYEPIDLETADGQRFADCAASVQRVLEDTLVDMTRALHQRNRLAGSLSRRRRGAQRRRQRADSRRVRLRARVRPVRSGRCGLRAGRGALCRPHLLRQPGPRCARSSVLGPDGRRRRSWRGRRARTARSSKSSTTRR